MQSAGHVSEPRVRKYSVSTLIVIGILLVCGMMLFFPSASSAKIDRAKKRLATDFKGPKDISGYYGGFLVDSNDKTVLIRSTDEAYFFVYAPSPADAKNSSLIAEISQGSTQGYRRHDKEACLLAPDPSLRKLCLLSKVWIAKTLLHDTRNPMPGDLMDRVIAGSAPDVKHLEKVWHGYSAAIRRQAEAQLQHNREVAAFKTGVYRYYQDGKGPIFEIKSKQDMWDFWSTLNDAYPDNRESRDAWFPGPD